MDNTTKDELYEQNQMLHKRLTKTFLAYLRMLNEAGYPTYWTDVNCEDGWVLVYSPSPEGIISRHVPFEEITGEKYAWLEYNGMYEYDGHTVEDVNDRLQQLVECPPW